MHMPPLQVAEPDGGRSTGEVDAESRSVEQSQAAVLDDET
jgi:hypothetical protein